MEYIIDFQCTVSNDDLDKVKAKFDTASIAYITEQGPNYKTTFKVLKMIGHNKNAIPLTHMY